MSQQLGPEAPPVCLLRVQGQDVWALTPDVFTLGRYCCLGLYLLHFI